MKMIKLIFKKVCPRCEATYKETIFEGTKEYFNQILDSDRFYLPQFRCCGNAFYADSYEILVDERLVRDGRIDDVFDIESQEDLT
ncbi:MAG: hypothetical protein ACM3SR_05415 [Ignavibacteriales bacterium]|jgi:hypothetical protein